MLRQRCRQQGRCATNHAKGFAPAMRTPPRYRTALKRRVIRVHGNHGPDLVIRRKISSRLTPVATHQLDSSGLRQRYYRFTQLEAEDFSAIKILGLVSGAASANRSSGYTDLGWHHRVLRRRFLDRVPRCNNHCSQDSYRQLSPGFG